AQGNPVLPLPNVPGEDGFNPKQPITDASGKIIPNIPNKHKITDITACLIYTPLNM
ncbi:MAG: hypothetical protein QG549_320, partial [Patescibacteria group bacterium]|nr:hypothetical protein [Patescibacteria group bacterium]